MKMFFFTSSHWDREWYQSFQGFRKRLVETVEALVRVMKEDPNYKTQHMDGQTILLEDVLEVRPDLREDLQGLIDHGRIIIGPWYVMPDEFLVSGEALIRDLMLGRRTAAEWNTDVWKFGYVCDIFGHIAQIPQIMRGFDIPYMLIWRGANDSTTPPYFRWKAPDGSETLVVRIADEWSYGAFWHWTYGSYEDELMPEEDFKAKARQCIEKELERAGDFPCIVLMNGHDHAPVNRHVPTYISWIKELYPDSEVLHTNLEEMGRELETVRDKLTTKQGEFIEPAEKLDGHLALITNTLSSYYPLKKKNDECQTMLERVAGPMVALRHLAGDSELNPFYDLAWRRLIKNHPHDSICGCSIDRVHEDMEYRFNQTFDLIGEIRDHFESRDRRKIGRAEVGDKTLSVAREDGPFERDLLLRIFNPLPFERQETVNCRIDFPQQYGSRFSEPFHYQHKNCFTIVDEKGDEVPYRITKIEHGQKKRMYKAACAVFDIYHITFHADLRPTGFTTYTVQPSKKPVRYLEALRSGNLTADNGVLTVEVGGDGAITVTDKRNGRKYEGLTGFVCDGEIGDGWFHENPVGDEFVYSSGTPQRISVTEDSPDRMVFTIERTISVPEERTFTGTIDERYRGTGPSGRRVELPITTKIGLSKNSPLLSMDIAVDNRARDHRLRMVIPTGIKSGSYFAYQTFTFIERPCGRIWGNKTADWKEAEPIEKNFSGIVGKRDADGSGIVFFSAAGLHEVAAPDDLDGSLIITLFRSFRRTVMTNGETRGQLRGPMSFQTALCFLEARDTSASIYNRYLRFSTPLTTYTIDAELTRRRQANAAGSDDDDATDSSLFRLEEGPVTVSTIKPPENSEENAVVIRLVNLSDGPAPAVLHFGRSFGIETVREVKLNEDPVTEPRTIEIDGIEGDGGVGGGIVGDGIVGDGAVVQTTVGAWELITLFVEFRE